MQTGTKRWFADVVVVGGGIAGLTAAAHIARSGRTVVVLEKSSKLGGRGGAQVTKGVHFNLGPHALYCGGVAMRTLRELGVPFKGAPPSYGRLLLRDGEQFHTGPTSLKSLLLSRLFTWREKWQLSRLQAVLADIDTREIDSIPLSDWLHSRFGRGNLARFLQLFLRVSTYSADADLISAGAAIDQLRIAREKGVWYLDGGWMTLIDGLRNIVAAGSGQVLAGTSVRGVHAESGGVTVSLGDESAIQASVVVLAVDPESAIRLLDLRSDSTLARWNERNVPVTAASLDVALSQLPRPERRVAFGLDSPLYYSVHSASARLAQPGVAVLHVARYLSSMPGRDPDDVQDELEAYLDQLQPGWRKLVITKRFLPHLVVSHSLVTAETGGTAGRPSVNIPGRPNVFLCGDWVGPEGMLADAAVASAIEAARLAIECMPDDAETAAPIDVDPGARPAATAGI